MEIIPNVLSKRNFITKPLAANAVFEGEPDEVYYYDSVTVSCLSDQDGDLTVEKSDDGITWSTLISVIVPAGTPVVESATILERYIRVVYQNGLVAQSYVKLQTIYASVSAPLAQGVGSDVVVTSSVLPTSAASSSLQSTGNAHLSDLNDKLPTLTLSGDRLKVELPAGGGGLTDAELRADALYVLPKEELKYIDEASDTVTYTGTAEFGSATSSAVWKIQKIVTAGLVTSIHYALGSNSYTNIWDNRAALSYS